MSSTAKLRSNFDDVNEANDVINLIADSATNEDEIDRKTRKRDIQKQPLPVDRDDSEQSAEVVEITKPMPTQPMQNVIVTTIATQSGMPTPISTTTMTPITNTTTTTATTSPSATPTPGIKPAHTFYYGGQPNQMADQIYITTSDPEQSTEAIATTTLTLEDTPSADLSRTWNKKKSDPNEFKPSVQYENDSDYRSAIDTHFVPITSPAGAYHPLHRLLQNTFLPAGALNASISFWKVKTRWGAFCFVIFIFAFKASIRFYTIKSSEQRRMVFSS